MQSEAANWQAFDDALMIGARSTRLSVLAESLGRALGAVCPAGGRRVILGEGAPLAEWVHGEPLSAGGVEQRAVAGDPDGLQAELVWAGAAADRAAAAGRLAEAAARLRPLLAAWTTLRRESATDPLTGAGNRRALDEQLATSLSLFARHAEPFAVVVLDAERFKAINDRDGHAAGDRALVTLADWLRAAIRTTDELYRFGGDEFVLVLPHTGTQGAARLARRIQAGAPIAIATGAAAASAGDTPGGLLDRADQALLREKRRRAGQGRVDGSGSAKAR